MTERETPKQRRERLEVERAHERHAALERRLQEAAERRSQMLYATRTAATVVVAAPSPPVATSSSPVPSDTSLKPRKEATPAEDQPVVPSAARASHKQQESWASRVLRSRGEQGNEHAKSSYSQILKGLRTKASKLRKRLSVEACMNGEGDSWAGYDSVSLMSVGDIGYTTDVDPCGPEASYAVETDVFQRYSQVAKVCPVDRFLYFLL